MMTLAHTSGRSLSDWEAELPPAPAPVATYVPCVQTGQMIFTSGMLPVRDGALVYKGRVGEAVSLEDAQAAARLCILNALSVIKAQTGSLGHIKRIVKMTGFVMGTVDFYQQPQVVNGASQALLEIFGSDVGQHARSAVGVANLPLESPVEIELIVELHA
jgi:enamine deaminase RidA (YjgF/YER057c/UK114 family)